MRITLRYLLAIPFILGIFLLLYDLGGRSIWSDEYFSYAVVFKGGFPSRVLTDIHPPMYYLLAIAFTKIGPDSLWMLRLFSVLCGIASIIIGFILCRRYFGTKAGDIFILLMPLNCHLILFSRMGRYYAPLMLLILLSQLAFDRLNEKRNWFNVILYAVSLAACFYTSLTSILIIPAHLTAAALRRKRLGYILAGQAYASATLLAWLPVVLKQLSAKETLSPFANDIPFSLPGFIARIVWPLYGFSFGENIPPWLWIVAIPGIIVVAVTFIWFLIKGTRRGEFTGYLVWILIPLAILSGAILPVGIEFLPPRAMFLLPFWLMLLAAGISRMPRHIMPIPVIVLTVVSIVGLYQYSRNAGAFHSTYIMPWAEIAHEADRLAGEGGIIVADDESIAYYLPDDKRLRFLSILGDPDKLTHPKRRVVLVVNPRDITPGGLLTPLLESLSAAGYHEAETREFLVEDEKTTHIKTRLLGREVSRVKKEVRLYLPN